MRGARRTPWAVAATLLALVIAFLSVLLITRAAPGRDEEGAETTAAPVDTAVAGTPSTDVTAATTREPRTDKLPVPDAAATADDLGTLLHGKLRTPAGPWSGDASIHLHVGEQSDPLVQAAWNSEASQFAVPGLAAGDYRLVVWVQGYHPFERAVAIPPGVPSLRVDVDLNRNWIVKVVLLAPDGRPLREALAGEKDLPQTRGDLVSVIASWSPLPPQMPSPGRNEVWSSVAEWRSNSQAFFQGLADLPARYAGKLEMREVRDVVVGAVFGTVVLAQAPVAAGEDEVTLTVDPQRLRASTAGVRLQVVDGATGSPLPEAKVTVESSGTVGFPIAVDAEGRHERTNLKPGRYRVRIVGRNGVTRNCSADLEPGHTTDLGTIAMSAPVRIRIRVPELEGADEPRCSLLPLDQPFGGAEIEPVRVHVMGAVLTAVVIPGRYRLWVAHGERGALVEIDTHRLGDSPIAVTLAPMAVLRIDGTGVDEPVRVELCTDDGTRIDDRFVESRSVELRLPPGDYRVRTQRIDGGRSEERVTLPPEGTTLVLR